MTRTVRLVETRPTEVVLSDAQARAVVALGKALASRATEWGSRLDTRDDTRTIISCIPSGVATWNITVSNAIGAFGVGDLTFVVSPKIPMQHVLYILSRGPLLPRLDDTPVSLAQEDDLWELVARWFLERTKTLIARDLIRDYESAYDLVSAVRGQIDAVPSAAHYYSGSLDVFCNYDEFTVDNAYNRVLLAALTALQQLVHLSSGIRRDSRRVANYFDEVGRLREIDLQLTLDRRSAHYHDGVLLAKLILSATALAIAQGPSRAWTFLIRTPEPMEAGIRAILHEGLAPEVQVRKRRIALMPREVGIDPDLCFDPVGLVGDVKYKVFGSDWPRDDLYQSVAFAAGAGSPRTCVISFAGSAGARLPAIRFKNIEVSHLVWNASEVVRPQDSAYRLVANCRSWLTGCPDASLLIAPEP